MFHEAVGQFDRVAKVMGLDDNISDRLRSPQRATVVSFPFRHDNYTEVETIFGYRVQHLTTMGPTKGGIRFAPDVDLGEVSALALLLGAAYLFYRRILTWHIPTAFVGTVVLLSGLFWLICIKPMECLGNQKRPAPKWMNSPSNESDLIVFHRF